MSDEITLALPAQEDFRQIAHLVVGGFGARLDLTYEDLDDLQTALDALLACRDDGDTVELRISVDGAAIRSVVGPFGEHELEALDSSPLGLRRVLETVADDVEVERDHGAAWIAFTKRTRTTAEAAG